MQITERYETDATMYDYDAGTITDYICGHTVEVTPMDADEHAGMTEHMRITWEHAEDAQAWLDGMLHTDGCVRATGMTTGYEVCIA